MLFGGFLLDICVYMWVWEIRWSCTCALLEESEYKADFDIAWEGVHLWVQMQMNKKQQRNRRSAQQHKAPDSEQEWAAETFSM